MLIMSINIDYENPIKFPRISIACIFIFMTNAFFNSFIFLMAQVARKWYYFYFYF